ncbi:MAG TPA: hypothetical protein VK737_04250, partial [Opitutales bacterium]|nr:hypothetical protein [Opitutales bacterium]
WFLVLGSWFLVLGSWFLVLGSWFLVLGSWFLVLATQATNPAALRPELCRELSRAKRGILGWIQVLIRD